MTSLRLPNTDAEEATVDAAADHHPPLLAAGAPHPDQPQPPPPDYWRQTETGNDVSLVLSIAPRGHKNKSMQCLISSLWDHATEKILVTRRTLCMTQDHIHTQRADFCVVLEPASVGDFCHSS